MKLFEFQAKRLFREKGIPTPQGQLLTAVDQVSGLTPPLVLKAQVLTGGRGKAGGIIVCEDAPALRSTAKRLFDMEIRGEPVRAVLAEEKAAINHEYYISITYSGTRAVPLIVASAAGGVEIERVAAETPEKILTMALNPIMGPSDYHIRMIAKSIGCQDIKSLRRVINGMWHVFSGFDASLVEINPLVSTGTGLVALDGKIVLDDKAGFRQEALLSGLDAEQRALPGGRAAAARADTITYVPLTGNVGLISDGAGTGMLTLDLIKDAGGEAADFCEMGGITNPQVMYDAMAAVLADAKVKSLLVVLIGGFNRMDEMAEGIIRYQKENGLSVPVTVRMCGTMEHVGIEMLRNAGIPTDDDLLLAVKAAVSAAGGAN